MTSPLKRKHELSVMNVFISRLKKAAEGKGKRFIGVPLDGQDAWLGADCFMTEGSRFAIAEFKYEESDIRSEKKKRRRLAMCKALRGDMTRLSEHLACHLIAWSIPDEKRTIVLNGYAHEVCNAQIWGEQNGLDDKAYPDPRYEDQLFIDEFLSGNMGLTFEDFEAYISWLSDFEDSGTGSIELLIENPNEDAIGALEFTSLGKLKVWMDNNPPRPTPPRSSSSSGPSFGP
ncbi:hypothetical protein [Thiolapillus brandeum]|uniref:Uncharacterized protein n=1 Tax=Thiolapillus brandeum TaxID=1076588 RepID=A0A7U6GKT3_9GAMM|nr:hypothetical protein [Thiolapillus brandeum]BAO45402.1 hypothetical protein TBH_C2494 [Thiolapillus brandeum]